jgi:glycosyltransferase involved in cell wall biosynthesis
LRLAFLAFHGSVHTRRWATYFAARGHDVHVITCGDPTDVPPPEAPNGDQAGNGEPATGAPYAVHDLGFPWPGKLGYLLKLHPARRCARAIAPDVVHAHYATSYGLLGLATGIHPFVVTAHGDDVLVSPKNPVMRPMIRRVLRSADLVTVPSAEMREKVEGLCRPRRTPISVFQYGVEAQRLIEVAGERPEDPRVLTGTAGDPLRIVSARPLLRESRVEVLIDALSILSERGVGWTCDVVGDGPERGTLEQRAASLGLTGRLAFHGQVSSRSAEEVIARSDIYVSVAESDGLSIALLEALALGSIPVVSDIPANRAWVDQGRTGLLIRVGPQNLAEGIERAIRLDRQVVKQCNQRLVRERADRSANLQHCENLLTGLSRQAPALQGNDVWYRRDL